MLCNTFKYALPVAKRALPLCRARCFSSTKEKLKKPVPQKLVEKSDVKLKLKTTPLDTQIPTDISSSTSQKQIETQPTQPQSQSQSQPQHNPPPFQPQPLLHKEQPSSNQPQPQTHLQRVDPLWKDMVKVFGERNALTYLDPLLLEEALSHRLVAVNLPSPSPSSTIPFLVNDRLVYLGHSLAELQLTEYYMDVLPRGASLAARISSFSTTILLHKMHTKMIINSKYICLYKKNLFEVGKQMGLDKLMHHQMLVTGSYQAMHHLPETKRLELATAESVLALVAATHLHHTKANTKAKPLFSHRYLALPLTLSHLIKEHRPKLVLDSFLRSRPRPDNINGDSNEARAWSPQTQPPEKVHSLFAIYKVINEVKGLTPLFTVGVHVDGKLLTSEYGTSIEEAEEMAAVRALEILRSNGIQAAVVARDQENE